MKPEATTNDNRQEMTEPQNPEPQPPSASWPPPARQQPLQTAIVRGPSPWLVITFFLGRCALAGAAVCVISNFVLPPHLPSGMMLIWGIVGLIIWSIGGLIAGCAGGLLLGLLSCAFYACGISSRTIARITCWLSPLMNMPVILLLLLRHLGSPAPLPSPLTLYFPPLLAVLASWWAGRIIASQFVERF